MRMGFGLIGLLLALAIVAMLAKKQMAATRAPVPPAPTVRVQGEQLQKQIKQQVDGLMQQPRAMPEDSQ